MTKIEQMIKMTEYDMEKRKETIAKNRNYLIDQLRRAADRLEKGEGLDIYQYGVDAMDLGHINNYAKEINDAVENLKQLQTTMQMLNFIAND